MRRAASPQKHRRTQPRRRTPPGASPGTLTPVPGAPGPSLEVMAYGPEVFSEHTFEQPDELRGLIGQAPVTWVNVCGLGDAEAVRRIGEVFGLHPLAQEDVLNLYQRAKVEPYGPHLFIVSRIFTLRNERLESEQLSLYLGPQFVLSFQERPSACLDPVRQRLRRGQGRLRLRGTDYLAYALLDATIDSYFPVLEDYGERLEVLEEEILARPDPASIHRIHWIKRDLLALRRGIWPLREAINSLLRDPLPMISEETRVFLRDCYDHCVQIIDLIETYRELGADLTDLYLSSVSFRTNEVMRLLTVVATIFIPLTFMAGVWGMNFDPGSSRWNMPELRWIWGYPFALGLMLAVAVAMLVVFRRRGWMGPPEVRPAASTAGEHRLGTEENVPASRERSGSEASPGAEQKKAVRSQDQGGV